MRSASVAEVKSRLSELLQCVEAGETISITRRGKPVARLVAEQPARKRVDLAALRAFAEEAAFQEESAGDFLARVRAADQL